MQRKQRFHFWQQSCSCKVCCDNPFWNNSFRVMVGISHLSGHTFSLLGTLLHHQLRLLLVGLCLGLLGPTPSAHADDVIQARLRYRKALKLYQRKQWKRSQTTFKSTLALLEKRHPKLKGRRKQFNTLGMADVDYHLGMIALTLQQPRKACRNFRRLRQRVQTLPTTPKNNWQSWRINPQLPERFQEANSKFDRICPTQPSLLTIQGLPAKAQLELQQPSSQAGQPVRWTIVSQPVPLTQTKATLRIQAPGYQTTQVKVTLPRWSRKTIKVSLKTKPKPRPRPRARIIVRRPPPPKPPKKISPWVWVGVGVGSAAIVAGTVTAVYFLTQPSRPNEVTGQLNPNVWE